MSLSNFSSVSIGKTALKFIKEYLAPTRCVFCGFYGLSFCADCEFLLDKNISECHVCRKTSYDFLVHESCKSKTYLDKVIPVYSYNDVAKLVVQKLKFEFDKEFGKVIAQQILKSESVKSLLSTNAVLVPVPLFKSRQEWRGFNQSEIIVEELISLSQTNLEKHNLLKRIKETSQQAKLDKKGRLKNMKDAFEINSTGLPCVVRNDSNIFLIDDITTTTSTLNECAKVLKENGFKNVSAVVFARGE